MCMFTDGNHGAASLCSVPTGDAGVTRGTLNAGGVYAAPIAEPLPHDIQDQGYHNRDTLQSRAAA